MPSTRAHAAVGGSAHVERAAKSVVSKQGFWSLKPEHYLIHNHNDSRIFVRMLARLDGWRGSCPSYSRRNPKRDTQWPGKLSAGSRASPIQPTGVHQHTRHDRHDDPIDLLAKASGSGLSPRKSAERVYGKQFRKAKGQVPRS